MLSLISPASVLGFLEDLTSIQPYSGWRNSATQGEAEALDYVADTLGGFQYLQTLGLELERQSFHVFAATELWDTRLFLTAAGREIEVPADAPRGHRHDVGQALRFDSDGVPNDTNPDPVVADGSVAVIRSAGEIDDLDDGDLAGRIAFLDYEVISPANASSDSAAEIVSDLIDTGIAGLVLVTDSSDESVGAPGALAGDGTALENVTNERTVPTLYTRLEDLGPAGITTWDELDDVESARLIWNTDVLAPGTSGNLVARIPGVDSATAVILGAHIDGPNSPAAIDNGINSTALLEVARVLDEAEHQPARDVYLVWFGSEELWLYGSQHFVSTHQELLDRSVAAFLMDAIVGEAPDGYMQVDGWSHSRFGNDGLAAARYLEQLIGSNGIAFDDVQDIQGLSSDHSVFSGFIPQAGFGFGSSFSRYAHTPYDTIEAVRGAEDQIRQVAELALLAAVGTGRDLPDLRVTPAPDRRALVLATHTEIAHMTGTTLVDLSRALAWEGFDVDVIPYGQMAESEDMESADVVVVLPIIDYPTAGGDVDAYDESWSDEEIDALVQYVERGGFLVLANSAARIVFGLAFDQNEDWADVNALSEPFGVTFTDGAFTSASAIVESGHPLAEGVERLVLIVGNGVPFTMVDGEVIAEAGGGPAAGIVGYGELGGEVLVLADFGILGPISIRPADRDNFDFLVSLARYSAGR